MSRSQMHPLVIVTITAFLALAAIYGFSMLTSALMKNDSARTLVSMMFLTFVYFMVGYIVSSKVTSTHLKWAAIAGLAEGLLITLVSTVNHLLFSPQGFSAAALFASLLSMLIGAGIATIGGWVASRGGSLQEPDTAVRA